VRLITPPLFVLSLVFIACSDDAKPDRPASTTDVVQQTPAATSAATGSPGAACDPARPHAAGNTNATFASGGRDRTYTLYVPESYDGATAVPLVFNLHGAGSNALQQAAYSRLQVVAADHGFITVAPNATTDSAGRQAWRFFGNDDTDTAFLGGLLDQLERDLCIDAARVYTIGISSGSAMSARLACALPDRIAAVGLVAALAYFPGCEADPTPVMAFHGTEDLLVPFEGGTGSIGLPVRPVRDSAADWAALNGCNPVAAEARVSENVSTVAYSECNEDVAVVLYVIEGGGHTWPGASAEVPRLGVTTQEVDATELMWEFFASQAASRAP
jgi:polyhydroxybutyrate depolymerase